MERNECFVCRTDSTKNTSSSEDFREYLSFDGCNGSRNLNRQLWNVFIVRKLLGLPQSLCLEILKLSNGRKNPSSWFIICQTCGKILGKAWKIHNEIVRLEDKLKSVGKRLRIQIRENQEEPNFSETVKYKETGSKRSGTQVEKRIWKWLMEVVEPNDTIPDIAVKNEITSPEPNSEEGHWEPELFGNDTTVPDCNASLAFHLDDNDTIQIPVETTVKTETEEDDPCDIPPDYGTDSEISFSDSDDDVWTPKRRRTRGQRKKPPEELEDSLEDLNNEKDKESVDNIPLTARRSRKKSVSIKSRSKDSIQKAKSSLRAKRSDAGTSRRKYTRQKRVKCSRCAATFRNDAELAPHVKVHEKCDAIGNEFDCKTCGYPCESERSLRQHTSLKHELQKYICDVCGYEAPRKGRLARHKKLHMNMVDAKTYQCDICQEKFNNYIGFTRHQRKEHAEELNINLFKCEKCPSAYTTNKMLQDHILHVHERNSKWCCDICGKGLLSEKNLKEHLETHEHRERSEICWVCGVDFLNNRSLREHVRKFHPNQHNTKYAKDLPPKEEPEKEYKCLYCTFTSPFRLVVMRHRKTHRDVFRHLCEICSNEYSSLASLVLHKKIAHGDGKTIVQCEWCQKSFAHKHYLQNHIPRCKMRPPDVVLPKSKKPFRDSLLVTPEATSEHSEQFSNDTTPKPEVKPVATEDVNYVNVKCDVDDPKLILCKYCKGYRTDNRGKMYDHVMKVHKDELEFKYSCDICDVKYTTKPSLNRHVAIHHSEGNMMACIYCQKVFRHWSLLRLHYKHSCKSMPPGAPIPEAPKRETEKKERSKKPKENKFRVPRKRQKAPGATTTRKRKKGQQIVDQFYYPAPSSAQDDSMEMGIGVENNSGHFSEQQPSTSSSPSTFPLMYTHPSTGAPGTGIVPGDNSGSVSAAAAAAMQMFSTYNSTSAGSGSVTGGHRGWW